MGNFWPQIRAIDFVFIAIHFKDFCLSGFYLKCPKNLLLINISLFFSFQKAFLFFFFRVLGSGFFFLLGNGKGGIFHFIALRVLLSKEGTSQTGTNGQFFFFAIFPLFALVIFNFSIFFIKVFLFNF